MTEPIPVSLAIRAVERAIRECDAVPAGWVNGYGDGITGPKTPATLGPTVEEQIAWRDADLEGRASTRRYHTVVSRDREAVLIVPGEKEEREAIAAFAVLARAGFRALLEYPLLDELAWYREWGLETLKAEGKVAAAVAPLIAHYDATAPGWRNE